MTKGKPKRGEIWLVNLDPTVGSEIKKKRPVIVLSVNAIASPELRIVAPITNFKQKHERYPWCVPLKSNSRNGLTKESTVDAFQIKCVSTYRFIKRLGALPSKTVDEIAAAVAICIDF